MKAFTTEDTEGAENVYSVGFAQGTKDPTYADELYGQPAAEVITNQTNQTLAREIFLPREIAQREPSFHPGSLETSSGFHRDLPRSIP